MIEFTLPAMTCNHCVERVTQAVRQVDPAAKVAIDLGTHRVRIEGADAEREAVTTSLRDAGYEPAPA
jgi:copper chaperone